MSKFNFDKVAAKIRQKEPAILREMANIARNHYVNSFKRSSWDGKSWREVMRRIPGTKAYLYPKKKGLGRRTRPILIGKGTLRRAVNSSVKAVTNKKIYFKVSLPYAAVHNYGTRKMPQRQFMGWDRFLHNKAIETIKKNIDQCF